MPLLVVLLCSTQQEFGFGFEPVIQGGFLYALQM
jgi:hypothetical protein